MSVAIRRLEFDGLYPDVQKIPEARVIRHGYLCEFFKCAGNQAPPALLGAEAGFETSRAVVLGASSVA